MMTMDDEVTTSHAAVIVEQTRTGHDCTPGMKCVPYTVIILPAYPDADKKPLILRILGNGLI